MPERMRRAPLGFGTSRIFDTPITMSAKVTRPFIPERVLVMGPAEVVSFKVDGQAVPVELCFGETVEDDAGELVFVPSPAPMWRVVESPAGTYFELELGPLTPEPPPRVPHVVRVLFERAPRLKRWCAIAAASALRASSSVLDWATGGDRRTVSAGAKGVVVYAPQSRPRAS